MIQYTTRELEASIFEDRHLEKKLKNHLKKQNIKMMSAVFYITPQGKYEVHLSVKAPKGQCIATKELAHEVYYGQQDVRRNGSSPVTTFST